MEDRWKQILPILILGGGLLVVVALSSSPPPRHGYGQTVSARRAKVTFRSVRRGA